MGKKRQAKSGSKKKRDKSKRGRQTGDQRIRADGLMTGMIGGFRRAVGVEESSKKSPVWRYILSAFFIILVLAVAVVVSK